MPKSGDLSDWRRPNIAGFPHGTGLIQSVRNASRGNKRKALEGKGNQPDESDKSPVAEASRVANPNQKYRVGGRIVEGKDFPGGQLPENARPSSPAPWKYTVEPSPDYLERFKRRKEAP